MAKGFILLRDALSILSARNASGDFIPCDIEVVNCNLREDTGGQRVTYRGVTLAGGPFGKKDSPRNANHWMNATRNIMVPGKSRPITIHNLLLTKLNEERVVI